MQCPSQSGDNTDEYIVKRGVEHNGGYDSEQVEATDLYEIRRMKGMAFIGHLNGSTLRTHAVRFHNLLRLMA